MKSLWNMPKWSDWGDRKQSLTQSTESTDINNRLQHSEDRMEHSVCATQMDTSNNLELLHHYVHADDAFSFLFLSRHHYWCRSPICDQNVKKCYKIGLEPVATQIDWQVFWFRNKHHTTEKCFALFDGHSILKALLQCC